MRRPAVVGSGLALVAVLLSIGMGFAAAALVGDGDEARQFDQPSYRADPTSLPTLMADVSESAPGRSLILADASGIFTDGYVLFAADSDRVRDVAAIGDRLEPEYGAGTTQLSPDGSRLAVGDLAGTSGDVLVVELTTGASRRYPVDTGATGQVDVLAWSPDGRRLAFSTDSLNLLDVTTGSITQVAVPSTGSAADTELLPGEAPMPDGAEAAPKTADTVLGVQAAFSPDGRSIAYDDGVDLEVYPVDGKGSPTRLTDKAVWLAGSAAWSPDGKSVLVTREEMTDVDGATSLLAIDVATRTATRMATFEYMDFSSPMPVGWRGPSEVLLSGTNIDGSLVVDAYGTDGERRERLMTFEYSTYSAQFASGLIGSAVARDGGFSGGPTPTWWRVTIGVLVGGSTALVCAIAGTAIGVPLMLRRRAATRRLAPSVPAFTVVAPGGFAPPSGPFVTGAVQAGVPIRRGEVPVAAWPPLPVSVVPASTSPGPPRTDPGTPGFAVPGWSGSGAVPFTGAGPASGPVRVGSGGTPVADGSGSEWALPR